MKEPDEEVRDPNSTASSPKAPGTAKATMSIAPTEASIASRTPPSSTSVALVSQAYPTQAHQSADRTSIPRRTPPQVGSSASPLVTWVIAKTKTRSKKSSSGVT